MNPLTADQLHLLLFPACNVAFDAIRGHFMRRNHENPRVYAMPVSNELAEQLSPMLDSSLFHVQSIDADGLNYKVIWDKTEWEFSYERKALMRSNFLLGDLAALRRRAEERRRSIITARLTALPIYKNRRDHAVALVERLLAGTEEAYQQRAREVEEMFLVIGTISLYIPINELIKELDVKKIYEQPTQEADTGAAGAAGKEVGEGGGGTATDCNTTRQE